MTNYQIKRLSLTDSAKNRALLADEIERQSKIAKSKIAKLEAYKNRTSEVRAHSFARDKLAGGLKSLSLTESTIDTVSENATTAELARQLTTIQAFNQSDTSNVSGIEAQQRNLRRVLRFAGLPVPRGRNWDLLLEVFSSEAFEEFQTWGSPRRFAIALEAVKRKVTKEALDTIMEEYKKSRTQEGKRATLDNLWEEHAGFNPFLM